MIKLKNLIVENPADYTEKDADDKIKLLRRKQKYDKLEGVGPTEASDHEGGMAKSQLERSMKYAKMIYKIVDNVGDGGDKFQKKEN